MGKSRSSISVWRIASPEPLGPTADYLTEAGRVMGTVGYMSPEQACGDIPDGRGDIFSLGCMLYEMATGCRAFPGDNAIAVLAAILRDQPADMDASGRRFPPDVKLLVSRCLAKQPGDRFRSVNEVAIALKKLVVRDGAARLLWLRGPSPDRAWRFCRCRTSPPTRPKPTTWSMA